MIRSRKLRRRVSALQDRLAGIPTTASLVARGMKLGERTYIAPKTVIDGNFCWLVEIGSDVIISAGVRILAHDASMKLTTGHTRVAPVTIADRVYIGAGAIICCGVTVGEGAVVGAGSVIRRDVPPGRIVAGNPASDWGSVADHAERHRSRQDAGVVLPRKGWTVPGGIDAAGKREMLERSRGADVYVE